MQIHALKFAFCPIILTDSPFGMKIASVYLAAEARIPIRRQLIRYRPGPENRRDRKS